MKLDGVIWVKASGKKLAEALTQDIFIQLEMECCQSALAAGDMDSMVKCRTERPDGNNLRPSIETALHVILPHACVVHVHALNTVAVSIQPRMSASLKEALRDLNWCRVPYVRPGWPLAQSVQEAFARQQVNVIVLDNHGLVVGADTPHEAAALVREVESRLAPFVRPLLTAGLSAAPALQTLCRESRGFKPAPDGLIQCLAFAADARQAASGGSLYPDHVVFLGPGIAIAQEGESLQETATRVSQERGANVKTVIAPGIGVAVQTQTGPTETEMLACLAQIVMKIQEPGEVTSLTRDAELELVNWEAEKYRQRLTD